MLSEEPSGELLDKITVNVSDAEESAPAELRKAYTDLCAHVEGTLGAQLRALSVASPERVVDLMRALRAVKRAAGKRPATPTQGAPGRDAA